MDPAGGTAPRPHYRLALCAHHVLAPPNRKPNFAYANTPYSSSEPNKSVIVNRQCGGEELKYVPKFCIGGKLHVTVGLFIIAANGWISTIQYLKKTNTNQDYRSTIKT